MARGPSAIYRVIHLNGWRVEDLRIADSVMEKARAGRVNYRQQICMAFRKRVQKDTGRDPGWINYNQLDIKEKRYIPAPAKKAVSKRSRPVPRKAQVTGTKSGTTTAGALQPHDDVGEGGCGCECPNCDLNLRHCGDRSTGCKKG